MRSTVMVAPSLPNGVSSPDERSSGTCVQQSSAGSTEAIHDRRCAAVQVAPPAVAKAELSCDTKLSVIASICFATHDSVNMIVCWPRFPRRFRFLNGITLPIPRMYRTRGGRNGGSVFIAVGAHGIFGRVRETLQKFGARHGLREIFPWPVLSLRVLLRFGSAELSPVIMRRREGGFG